MIAIMLLPIYILLNAFMYISLSHWLDSCGHFFKYKITKKILLVLQFFLSSCLLIAFLLPSGNIRRIFQFIGNYWLGIMIYSLMVNVFLVALWFILWKIKRFKNKKIDKQKLHFIFGIIGLLITLIISTYGIVNSRIIHNTEYDVIINKEAKNLDSLKLVMVADLHLGYNINASHIKNMTQKINSQNPDIVIFAGDIFDNEFDAIYNPDEISELFKSIDSKYGVYAVYGNHDVNEKILAGFTFAQENKTSDSRMDKLLFDSNIKLLDDEFVLIDDSFYIYGRPDYSKSTKTRKMPNDIVSNLDKSKPIIVVDHQPRELEELAKNGVDLDLSGHTHDGQIFPINLLVNFYFKNKYGIKEFGDMTSIVTSGVGVYGPNMRVGTIAEITTINLKFNK